MRVWIACLLLLASLSGCAKTSDPVADVEPPVVDVMTNATVETYLRNVSEPMPGLDIEIAIVEQYRTVVDEFVELDTWIARPDVEGPVPLVLEVTPYYGGGDPSTLGTWGRVGEILVERGFAVGISSVRGTGNSGGCFTQGGPQEARDTATVVEHLAQQPWSNGNIGLMGVSYPGTTPQDVWIEAPPSLKTIVPISGISDMYKYNFVNGVPINVQGFGFNTYYWAIVGLGPAGLSGGAQALDPAHVATAAAGEACADQADVQQGGVTSTADGNKDDYWQVRDFLAEYEADPDRDRASVFYIHGLQDWNVKPHMMEDWLPAIQQSGVPYKVWLGQWGHAWPSGSTCEVRDDGSQPACRADWWESVMVAWFDQFLKGKDTGILDAPAVQVQDDDMQWRHEEHFPPLDAEPLRFRLAPGSLQDEAGTGTVSYHDRRGGLMPLPTDQDVPDRVVFRSEVLEENLHISGMPVFHANVTADGKRASFILTLAEAMPDGTLRSVNFGAQSLNHVDDLAAGDLDISGQTQEVHLRFFPQDDVLHAGSHVVLIASGNTIGGPGPSLQPVSDGGMIHIELDGAWFELPVDRDLVFEDPQPYS